MKTWVWVLLTLGLAAMKILIEVVRDILAKDPNAKIQFEIKGLNNESEAEPELAL